MNFNFVSIREKPTTRTPLFFTVSCLLVGCLASSMIDLGRVVAADPNRPDIILMMGDDHGWEETRYNGHPYLHTPVLDEMAATGLRMDRFYAAHPSCSPTRGSFLTGRHPNRFGTFAPGWSIRPEEISIAQILAKAGYRCGHFGKWHVGPVKAESPTNPGALGFHEWVSHDNFFELDPPLSRNGGPPVVIQGESSEVIIREAIRFIDESKSKGQPIFVVVWFGSPHEPYSGLPQDLALYDELPKKYDKKLVKLTSNETGQQVQRPQGEVLRERYAEITAMDRAIGILRNHLSTKGMRDDTLLFYCGDNGTSADGSLISPHRGVKGQVYDGGTLVPCVIEWPSKIKQPMTSNLNASTSDLLPTVCAIIGQSPPDRPLDGIDLFELIDAGKDQRDKPIAFWNFNSARFNGMDPIPWIDPELQKGTTPLVKLQGSIATRNFINWHHPEITDADFRGGRAIVDNRYKLVVHDQKDGGMKVELFDLQTDAAEQNNLAKKLPEITDRLMTELRSWQESVLKSVRGGDY